VAFVGERGQHHDRPEDLLGEDVGVRRDVGEHGRLEEVTGSGDRAPAREDPRALRDGTPHELVDLPHRAGVDERADVGSRYVSRAEPQCRHPLHDPVGEGLRHVGLHQEPVRGGAGLPAVAKLGLHGTHHGGVQIGVVEHNERGVATQLHRRAQHPGCGLCQERAPHRRRAREAELAQPRVRQ